jgi:ankyrin repeat protein
MVRLLLSKGINVNTKDKAGFAPIHYAVANGQTTCTLALLEGGAEVDAATDKGRTALHMSAMKSDEELLSAQLEAEADVDTISDNALHQARSKNGTTALMRLLLSYGACVNSKDFEGCAPIYYAADKDDAGSVSALLEAGADATATTHTGETALHRSALNGNTKLVRLLLDGGAKVNAQNDQGFAPIHFAGANLKNCDSCVSALLEGGADVDLTAAYGMTFLHATATKGNTELVRLLLDSGANINAKSSEGFEPIHRAAMNLKGNAACMSVLLERGADADITSEGWTSLLQLLDFHNAKQCEKLLKTHAASVRGFGKRSVRHQSNADSQQPRGRATTNEIGSTNSTVARGLKLQSPAAVAVYQTSDDFFNHLHAQMRAIGADQGQFSWVDAEQQFKSEFTGLRARDEEEEKRLQAALLEAAGLDRKYDPPEPCWPSLDDFDGESDVDSETEQKDYARAGGAMSGQLQVDIIELAPPAVKWLERANQPERDMLLSRLTRLMQGHRSYALSKRLQNTR